MCFVQREICLIESFLMHTISHPLSHIHCKIERHTSVCIFWAWKQFISYVCTLLCVCVVTLHFRIQLTTYQSNGIEMKWWKSRNNNENGVEEIYHDLMLTCFEMNGKYVWLKCWTLAKLFCCELEFHILLTLHTNTHTPKHIHTIWHTIILAELRVSPVWKSVTISGF